MGILSDYETLIWDFNGTILDDVDLGIECANALLSRRGLPLIPNRDRYFELFGFPIEDYYRRLGFDFSREPYEVLAHEWIAEYRSREKSVPLRAGVSDLLAAVREAGVRQVVLSATESSMLGEQLRDLGILACFDEVVGRGDIYAPDKTALARRWAEERKPGRALLIGDTEHDLACARAAGFDCLLVRGGHTSDSDLDKLDCRVANDLFDVKEILFNAAS